MLGLASVEVKCDGFDAIVWKIGYGSTAQYVLTTYMSRQSKRKLLAQDVSAMSAAKSRRLLSDSVIVVATIASQTERCGIWSMGRSSAPKRDKHQAALHERAERHCNNAKEQMVEESPSAQDSDDIGKPHQECQPVPPLACPVWPCVVLCGGLLLACFVPHFDRQRHDRRPNRSDGS